MSEADLQTRPAASPVIEETLQDGFRQAMRRLAGGVALVSTVHEGVRHGMTVTAVTSLTMDPPALVVSVNRHASAFDALLRSGTFCVNLLTQQHADLAVAFSRKPDGDARFANGAWRMNDHNLPSLDGSIASITCRVHDTVEYGTHAILIGAVEHLEIESQQPMAPLIYLSGQFGGFWPLTA
ncbi:MULTISPECIES: flavin reductase family protein [unclassified Caballeronia]|uniref:flavin reductase family protein n=1 Tax=unclassified Caballeronia TaxID=2646786 RepID=UPI0028633707|nr:MULTISPECIES: flavin reductase family protein [unclassified Caballeronia]MDR5815115.1 flavin reductase family protein [Caballeronia sp. LZ033]MDR5879806.1 flavin reductase family protein [Caballeronia sp. LZ032]